MSEEILNIVDEIVKQKGTTVNQAIPILQAIQETFNYLPEEALKRVCETTEISASRIYGISTFYTQFRHKPVGKHIIKVCVGTACHVKGSMQVYDAIRRNLNLNDHEDTDPEGLYTVQKVACLGCCTIAPVVQIDDITYGHLTPEKVDDTLVDFQDSRNNKSISIVSEITKFEKSQGEIRIGLGSCCVASGSQAVKEELESVLHENKINATVKQVGCVGICNQVPLLEIQKPETETTYYTKIQQKEVKDIVLSHFQPLSPIQRLKTKLNYFVENLVYDGIPKIINKYPAEKHDTPISEFLEGQINIATENRGVLKPTDIEEYKSLYGLESLRKCLNQLSSDQIIEEIKKSGLRGRGGAGFYVGKKWQLAKDAISDEKYVICNGDEGDPGAFMDRMLLESYPYRIIEGMIIAGYAIGAKKGIFYIRAEYQLAVKRVNEAIQICQEKGLLGENIMNSGFSFDLSIFEGAGAFICGEETALIASVEGKRGMPSIRPPYPVQQGLWNKPTLVNNTETFSTIPWIIRNGSKAFSSIGSDQSKGTKVFALAGKVRRGGLIEIPMGITIRKIVEEIGGGIARGKEFKAVQIGGPSGGCIPASMADTPIDFESLTEIGAMMGSGGLVVLDETDCMVDIARYFLSFTQDQSCGKCTFCRIGTRRMLEILNKICKGQGKEEDLVQLEKLAYNIKKGSICGLAKTAPNPVLSTLKYFRNEYEEHINGKCSTGKCKELIQYNITEDCIGCTKCAQQCPSGAIEFKPYEVHKIDVEKCIKCDICRQVCPVEAVLTIQNVRSENG